MRLRALARSVVVLALLLAFLLLSARPQLLLAARLPASRLLLPFDIGVPIDCSITGDMAALRRVARARAVWMARGPELILTAAQRGSGAAVALNALLNLHALGYTHGLLIDNDDGLCEWMSRAASRLRSDATATAVRGTPCLVDSWWRSIVLGNSSGRRQHATRTPVLSSSATFYVRLVVLARLVRLGYNVLTLDVDVAILDDVYAHLHSAALSGRFTLMFASENRDRANGLQNGLVYAVGARRDGAAAWVLAETIDRLLRTLDACENGGTPCPPGSWLRGAWLFHWSDAMDQTSLIDVCHTAAARDGRIFWLQVGRVVHRGWPFRQLAADGADDTTLLHQLQAARGRHGVLQVKTRRGESPSVGAGSRGAGLASATGEAEQRSKPFRANWIDASLRLTTAEEESAGEGDPARRWAARFGTSEADERALWGSIRPAVPLARQLPTEVAALLDAAWQHRCPNASTLLPETPPELKATWAREQELCQYAALSPRRGGVGFALAEDDRGLLPHVRGALSQAWQVALDTDIAADSSEAAPGAEQRRASTTVVRDAVGGAAWAAAPDGDEAVVQLPAWVVSHWGVARYGLVGALVPRTLIFHAVNAHDLPEP
jgi:hypothetical protein